jgi:purine-nucleoside phosphorylase
VEPPTEFGRKEWGEAAEFVLSQVALRPKVGMILGSGLGSLVDLVQDAVRLPYSAIPYFPPCSIEGHEGILVVGSLEGVPVAIMQGRTHYYEGYSMQHITLPVRAMRLMGIDTLFVTNAAGGIQPHFHPGELMMLTDHINLVGMAGASPLRGPNDESFGPRFPDLTRAYDAELRGIARRVADEKGIPLHEGVYIMLAGPSYETVADVHFLKLIGVDAVGMSTVPEVTVARHSGMRVLAVSGISNVMSDRYDPDLHFSHEEVLAAGRSMAPRMGALLRGVLGALGRAAVR